MMTHRVLFDVRDAGYGYWWLVLLLFGPVSLAREGWRRRRTEHHPGWLAFSVGGPIFMFCVFALALGGSYWKYRELSWELNSGLCRVTEGVVTDFHAMPAAGHADEWFTVNGERFSYSTFVLSAGYNRTLPYGGPVRNGSQLRIYHFGNDIARLEITQK